MLNATPLLKLYAGYRARGLSRYESRAGAASVQQHHLKLLLRAAADTKFGRDHGFAEIRSVAEYQERVPLRSYDSFWNEYWKAHYPRLENITWPGLIPYFALSSGTSSGTTKYIPISNQMVRSNTRSGLDLLSFHIWNRRTSRIMGGRSFMLGGSTDLTEPHPGVFAGDLSGIAVKTMPSWATARYFPPPELALLKDWEEKVDRLARESLTKDIRMLSGVPSWLLIFAQKLQEVTGGKSLAECYPNLEMLVHGGVSFTPYQAQFHELLRGSKAELREVYPASEGFLAIADRGFGDGLRLLLDHGLFYEFVPLEELQSPNPTRHWIANVEPEVNYAVVLTTCAGLWSYILGDTVRFVDTAPPRILITGRTSYYLSAFGEHLIAEEIEDGVTSAARHIGAEVREYSVGALFPAHPGELGGHLYVVEFTTLPSSESLIRFAEALDKRLCERNEDYEAHRAKGFGLNAPKILAVPPDTFSAWMKERGKLGGQNKVPRIITDQTLFSGLRTFAESRVG